MLVESVEETTRSLTLAQGTGRRRRGGGDGAGENCSWIIKGHKCCGTPEVTEDFRRSKWCDRKGMLGIILFKSARRSREGMRLTGSSCDGQRLRVAQIEDTLGTPLLGPKNSSLLPLETSGYYFLAPSPSC